jgi:hypothetical protein
MPLRASRQPFPPRRPKPHEFGDAPPKEHFMPHWLTVVRSKFPGLPSFIAPITCFG